MFLTDTFWQIVGIAGIALALWGVNWLIDREPKSRKVLKPRLRKSVVGIWYCEYAGTTGIGVTPAAAYRDWAMRELSTQPGAWGCP